MVTISVSILLVLTISFICSLCEAVLLSLSPAFVAVQIEAHPKSGKILKNITDHLSRSLSAILTLNTITHTLGSSWIAYTVHETYGEKWLTLVSIVFTVMVLVFSEVVPKSIGQNHAKSLSLFCCYIIQVMIIILYPFVKISESISKVLSSPSEEPDVTRDEMVKNAEIAVEEGTLKAKESVIINNLMKLDKVYVSDIMTPRSVMMALDSEMTVEEVYNKYKPIRFSRIPVYEGTLDHIIGLTHRYKILEALSSDQHGKKMKELVAPISSLSERISVSHALDFFVKEKSHLSLVTDDYGVITGLVTLEDTVETLLGVEIVDEFDNIEDMRKFALDQWKQRKQNSRR